MENKRERIVYWDIARYIGLFGIIIAHNLLVRDVGLTIKNIISLFDVPIFFIASGYFIKNTPIKDFIKARGKTLIIPYMFCGAIFVSIALIRDYFIGYQNYVGRFLSLFYGSGYKRVIISNIVLIESIYGLWFLLALFWAAVIVRVFYNKKYRGLIYLAISLLGFFSAKHVFLPFSIQPGMVACIYVYIGVLIKKYNLLEKVNLMKLITFTLLTIISVILTIKFGLYVSIVVGNMSYYIVGLILSVIVTLFLLYLSMFIEKVPFLGHLLIVLGQNTLVILFIHLVNFHIINYYWLYYIWDCTEEDIAYATVIVPQFLYTLGILIVNKSEFLSKVFNVKNRRTKIKEFFE